jgi:hypothetical protein
LDQRWGAAGLGQAGLLNMAILMAIESQSWKKTWLKHLRVLRKFWWEILESQPATWKPHENWGYDCSEI